MKQKQKMSSFTLQLLGIICISIAFGMLGFLYSFFGFFDQTQNFISLDPFSALTAQEIGGHFLFGFVISIPVKNLKMCILTGLMALTIDSDHLLNAAGLDIQGRMDHSILFAILSSIIMSFISSKIYYTITRSQAISEIILSSPRAISVNSGEKSAERIKRRYPVSKMLRECNRVFSLFFLSITMAAFLSHIAYDVFVDDNATLPLLYPFSYNQFIIPRRYGLPLEAAGFLMVLLFCLYYTRYRGIVISEPNHDFL